MYTHEFYQINELVSFTGLTDRTIRNYISTGILQGEKVNGVWQFTIEQVESFITHPSVRPSILAKNNGLVYDFLMNRHTDASETCIIMDVPGADKMAVASYFCDRINSGEYKNVRFTFDGTPKSSRVILKGYTDDVIQLITSFNSNVQK